MDSGEKDKFGMEKRSGDNWSYQTSDISVERQFGNQSIGIPDNRSTAICQGSRMGSSPCPSVSMVDSFCPSLWNHPTYSQSFGFCENASSSSSVPIGIPVPTPSRLDMGGVFSQTGPGLLPPSLSHFPTDSGFIERAARFSCFNGGTFSGMMNPFSASEPLSPHSSASKDAPGSHIQKSEMNMTNPFKDASQPIDHDSNGESPIKDQRHKGCLHGVGVSSNESGEPEFSGGGQEEIGNVAGDSSSRGLGAKKRKMANQDMELDQVEAAQELSVEATETIATTQKVGHTSSITATAKHPGKQDKDSSNASKEDYIHVRARRGQATNSHSLAERVRREKISERMKYLQDLVPGCSKVTGKAVMLDEIINYVQSLQRQVEFLSMKLASVNPRLEFNIEGLLSKDFLQSRGGCSSMGFSHDMMHPQLHLPQQGFVQAGMSGITHPSDALRRLINAQLSIMSGYKEPTPQMNNAWDDELNNVIQMNFGTATPSLDTQELNGKPSS